MSKQRAKLRRAISNDREKLLKFITQYNVIVDSLAPNEPRAITEDILVGNAVRYV